MKKKSVIDKIEKLGKPMTIDGKAPFEAEVNVLVKMTVTNKMTMMLHEEYATGNHKDKEFRLIGDIGHGGFKLSYGTRDLSFSTRSLVTAMMDEIQVHQ